MGHIQLALTVLVGENHLRSLVRALPGSHGWTPLHRARKEGSSTLSKMFQLENDQKEPAMYDSWRQEYLKCRTDPAAPHYIILADGEGVRMNSDLSEVLHPVAEVPMLCHVLKAVQAVQRSGITVVVNSHGQAGIQQVVEQAFPELQLDFVAHEAAKGRADAVQLAVQALPEATAEVMILPGNLPLLTAETLEAAARREGDPARSPEHCSGVVEFDHDACSQQQPREHPMQWAAVPFLRDALGREGSLDFLTAADWHATSGRQRVAVLSPTWAEPSELECVDSRQGLAVAEDVLRQRLIKKHQAGGVTFRDPRNTFLSADVRIGRDSVIGVGVQLSGKTTIGKCVRIDGPTVVKDASIGDGARIGAFSHVEQAVMAPGAGIGPFARLRVGAAVDAGAYVGNFCEVKNARVGPRTNVCHLSYLGDAELGENVNIGAGTITCNFNGIAKNRTVIGADAFIGSATTLVAPVAVGAGALVAAGSVLTEDVPADALALGRARQTTKAGRAGATREKLREREARKPGGGGGH